MASNDRENVDRVIRGRKSIDTLVAELAEMPSPIIVSSEALSRGLAVLHKARRHIRAYGHRDRRTGERYERMLYSAMPESHDVADVLSVYIWTEMGLLGLMPEDHFWMLVDAIGWGTRTTNFLSVRTNLRNHLIKEQAQGADGRLHCLGWALDAVIGTEVSAGVYDPWPFGDESYCNFIHHVIGLGKTNYYKVLHNPQLAADLFRKNDYVGSFLYCFPYIDDYDDSHADEDTNVVKWSDAGGFC